ncbi:MAG: hypothetical protein ABI670_22475 [Chloroflexota bacterium]
MDAERINIAMDDIVEYGTFRRNPGPLIKRATTNGRPLLVIKGRQRVVMLEAAEYERLVQRAVRNDLHLTPSDARTGTEG